MRNFIITLINCEIIFQRNNYLILYSIDIDFLTINMIKIKNIGIINNAMH